MSLTLTDLFCGAGGSSTGATTAGVEVRLAANHWALAVETHQVNHPTTDHDVADISQTDPRRYPATDLLWASPECTNHSLAKAQRRSDQIPDLFGTVLPDAAAERSRATMWDVCRFVEAKLLAGTPYAGFVVENVVDIADWLFYRSWRLALEAAGYCLHPVWLNSMHAAAVGPSAPQSRDRWYCVGHQVGIRCPDLDRWTRPTTWCPGCSQDVRAVQAWKRPDHPGGRYRAQYTYRCPTTSCRGQQVEPAWIPAGAVIDWSNPGRRIADRARPLSPRTVHRIERGLTRYHTQTVPRPPATAPPGGQQHHGLLVPCGGGWNTEARSTNLPFSTRTTRETDGVVQVVYGYDTGRIRPASDPLPTQTTVVGDAVLTNPTTHQDTEDRGRQQVDVAACTFRMLTVPEIRAGMAFGAHYQLLGNRREQIRQLGNAVTPNAARDLLTALTEVIT